MLEQNKSVQNEQVKLNQLDTDFKFYAQSWIWRAVEALVLAKDFDPSPTAIASRLNISLEASVDALEGLERIQAIKRVGRTFERSEALNNVTADNTTKSELLSAHTSLAPQILSKLNEESIFTTQICLGSLTLAKSHASKLIEFLNALDQEGRTLDNPDILAIDISIAKIGNSKNTGGVQ